ncbi:hypothetical protein LCGC14_0716240, partial [marine sediment metagenome]
IDRSKLESGFNTVKAFIEQSMEEQNTIIEAGLSDQISARRKALQTETDVIRDGLRKQTNEIRDELEEQTRVRQRQLKDEIQVIQDTFRQQTDLIRDNLVTQLDEIRSQLNDRIDLIRENAKAEIDVHKEKISAIQDQERELEQQLSQLRSRRADIFSERIRAEAELAALERAAAAAGVDATEEIAIIEARMEGLDKEQQATEDAIDITEDLIDTIAGQIEEIEDLIDIVEDARDEAIDAARQESRVREREARKAATTAIEEINKVRDAAIRAADDRADADIEAAQKAAAAQIYEAQRASTLAQRAAQERSGVEIAEYRRVAGIAIALNEERHQYALDAADRELEAQRDILGVMRAQRLETIRLANFVRSTLIPELQKIAQVEFPAVFGKTVDMLLQERQTFQRAFIKSLFPEADAAFFKAIGLGFKHGGIVPGPIGKPQLAVVHGKEIITEPGQLPPGLPSAPVVTIYVEHVDVNRPADLAKIVNAVNRGLGQKTVSSIRLKRLSIR